MQAIMIYRNRSATYIKWIVSKMWMILSDINYDILNPYKLQISVLIRFVEKSLRIHRIKNRIH